MPDPHYTAEYKGVVLNAKTRVEIERTVDQYIASQPSKEVALSL